MNRLIETWDVLKYGVGCANLVDTGLIETWDVLKSEFAFPPLGGVFTINRNMRCIEMQTHLPTLASVFLINRNMRCIEIYYTMTEKDAE